MKIGAGRAILFMLVTAIFSCIQLKMRLDTYHGLKHLQQQQMFYYCPRHPQVTVDHPGVCPICGMTLDFVNKKPPHPTPQSRAQKRYNLQ